MRTFWKLMACLVLGMLLQACTPRPEDVSRLIDARNQADLVGRQLKAVEPSIPRIATPGLRGEHEATAKRLAASYDSLARDTNDDLARLAAQLRADEPSNARGEWQDTAARLKKRTDGLRAEVATFNDQLAHDLRDGKSGAFAILMIVKELVYGIAKEITDAWTAARPKRDSLADRLDALKLRPYAQLEPLAPKDVPAITVPGEPVGRPQLAPPKPVDPGR